MVIAYTISKNKQETLSFVDVEDIVKFWMLRKLKKIENSLYHLSLNWMKRLEIAL